MSSGIRELAAKMHVGPNPNPNPNPNPDPDPDPQAHTRAGGGDAHGPLETQGADAAAGVISLDLAPSHTISHHLVPFPSISRLKERVPPPAGEV